MTHCYSAILTRFTLILLLFSPATAIQAANPPAQTERHAADLDAREQSRQQERERALQQKNTPDADIRLSIPTTILPDYPSDEKPCFTINTVQLQGEEARRFQWALKTVKTAQNRCLGAQGIQLLINRVQNAILQQGYVTTRLLAQEQDLTRGTLTLTVVPGRIGQIRFSEPASWRARSWNAVPAHTGDIVNLRDIEQALENFKKVPSVEADIKIAPGEQENTSDLVIDRQESRPVHLSLGLDDSGLKSTGKYLGSMTFSVDAPFAQNDLFYANLGKDLWRKGPFSSRSRTVNYQIPFGYWQLAANYNDYQYHQNIAGVNETLTYSGKSNNTRVTLSRLLFRNQSHKTTLNMSLFRRYSDNSVNDVEIRQQRRRTAGWELGLSQRSYFGDITMDAALNWRRGTGAFRAIPAPEESFQGGTARPGILMTDLALNVPFRLGNQPLRYYTTLRGQWSNQPLTPQDRLSIGGRYSVRGFDGEQNLSAEKGLISRNELAWNMAGRGHETYLALDYGRVAGPAARYLAGQQLMGGAIGIRGTLLRRVSYDLFAGIPLYKPSRFETIGTAVGFSLNLQI